MILTKADVRVLATQQMLGEDVVEARFDDLYHYFTAVTNEMPYGVAKARTGDPHQWIADQLDLISTSCDCSRCEPSYA